MWNYCILQDIKWFNPTHFHADPTSVRKRTMTTKTSLCFPKMCLSIWLMKDYKGELLKRMILIKMRWTLFNFFLWIHQFPKRKNLKIRHLTYQTVIGFYSIKAKVTFQRTLIFDETLWKCFMTPRRQDTQGNLGHLMQCNNTFGGLAFEHLSKTMFKAVASVNSLKLTGLLQNQLTFLPRGQNRCSRLLIVQWILSLTFQE